mmetsp:Transcript_40822/g.96936  ORF Transcript_40822/g.96936 Transcript_40822/m.96936 type:complete len:224 (+) Transcript_40822:261-932(+)
MMHQSDEHMGCAPESWSNPQVCDDGIREVVTQHELILVDGPVPVRVENAPNTVDHPPHVFQLVPVRAEFEGLDQRTHNLRLFEALGPVVVEVVEPSLLVLENVRDGVGGCLEELFADVPHQPPLRVQHPVLGDACARDIPLAEERRQLLLESPGVNRELCAEHLEQLALLQRVVAVQVHGFEPRGPVRLHIRNLEYRVEFAAADWTVGTPARRLLELESAAVV